MENILKATENLHKTIERQAQKISELETLVKWYEEQYRLSQRRLFGASSEKTAPSGEQ
jgi:hypothetical protein